MSTADFLIILLLSIIAIQVTAIYTQVKKK